MTIYSGMLILLSPAKNLDFSPAAPELPRTLPRMTKDIGELARVTRKLKRADIQSLMGVSDKIADLNVERFKAFSLDTLESSGKQAALAFNGDVYQGLQASTFAVDDLVWAQDHLRILSGLYGLLRPLDAIHPYRLEMGIGLPTKRGETLYAFWGKKIANLLDVDSADHANRALINLASTEYATAIDKKALKSPMINVGFHELKDGKARIVGFYAKKARGLMARFAVENRIDTPEGLKDFTEAGYRYDASASKPSHWVFSRPQPELKNP